MRARTHSQPSNQPLIDHFQQRCKERIGYVITQGYLRELREKGIMKVMERQGSNRIAYLLRHRLSPDMVVVYDTTAKTFVTILFKDEFNRRRHPELRFEASKETEGK